MTKKARDRAYYQRHRKKLIARNVWTKRLRLYGITEQTFMMLLYRQESTCRGCSKRINRSACVDHDHKTGEVRGLLCASCNIVLGKVKDNPITLRTLADYLEDN